MEDADHLAKAGRLLVSGQREAGVRELERLQDEKPQADEAKRKKLSLDDEVAVFKDDGFCCRYCGRKTIVPGVLQLLAYFYADELPFKDFHMKASGTAPAIIACTPNVDHVDPAGGNQRDNLVTACTLCNESKGRQVGGAWKLIEPKHPQWDGLVGIYRDLWELADSPSNNLHERWFKALEI